MNMLTDFIIKGKKYNYNLHKYELIVLILEELTVYTPEICLLNFRVFGPNKLSVVIH